MISTIKIKLPAKLYFYKRIYNRRTFRVIKYNLRTMKSLIGVILILKLILMLKPEYQGYKKFS